MQRQDNNTGPRLKIFDRITAGIKINLGILSQSKKKKKPLELSNSCVKGNFKVIMQRKDFDAPKNANPESLKYRPPKILPRIHLNTKSTLICTNKKR